MSDLDARLLDAHARDDRRALAELYEAAADMMAANSNIGEDGSGGGIDAACFFLTQAYIFALDTGAPRAAALHARLKRHGREE